MNDRYIAVLLLLSLILLIVSPFLEAFFIGGDTYYLIAGVGLISGSILAFFRLHRRDKDHWFPYTGAVILFALLLSVAIEKSIPQVLSALYIIAVLYSIGQLRREVLQA